MVHSEMTSGILNDIEAVGKVVKDLWQSLYIDAMSSSAAWTSGEGLGHRLHNQQRQHLYPGCSGFPSLSQPAIFCRLSKAMCKSSSLLMPPPVNDQEVCPASASSTFSLPMLGPARPGHYMQAMECASNILATSRLVVNLFRLIIALRPSYTLPVDDIDGWISSITFYIMFRD